MRTDYIVTGRLAPGAITQRLGRFRATSEAHAIILALRACIKVGENPCEARAVKAGGILV